MAANSVVLFYCGSSRRALRVVIPDSDKEVAGVLTKVRDNEVALEIPTMLLNGRFGLDALLPVVSKHLNQEIFPPVRCVIVDANGLVVDHGMIEPDLYVLPTATTQKMQQDLARVSHGAESPILDQPTPPFTVKPHDEADVGGKFNGDIYTPVIAKRAIANADDIAP